MKKMKVHRMVLPAALLLVLAGCESFGKAMNAHTDVLARAAGREFRVDDAATMLARNAEVPADPQVARAIGELWIDYTLLAIASAEDPTLEILDLDSFTREAREQMLVWKLREAVIEVDTVFTDEQLRERWAAEGPGAEIRARHILLRIPADATPAQRDSVRTLAQSLQQRAAGGEDFAALAGEYSQDPGSAARGGDLGFFGRGRMVAPFEEVAFRLQPGQVGPVVESPFGLHVIRVEERRQADFEPQREDFRRTLVMQAEEQAETAYLDSLTAAAEIQLRPGALAMVRELAGQPDVTLRGRAAERVIAGYRGGSFTAGEFAQFIRTQNPQVQNAFATATDEQLEGAVEQIVRREILVEEARRMGLSLTAEEERQVRQEARDAIREVVEMAGFARQVEATGGSAAAAADQQVRELLQAAIDGEAQLVPLGHLSHTLRDRYGAELFEQNLARVISRLEEIRAQQPARAPGGQAPQGELPQQPAALPEGT
jgi:parvulin-like peptidyl-prolyl isomerase